MNSNKTGPEYWRSVQHLAESPQVQELIEQEFPGYNPDELVSMPRRKFLKLMGASMALSGLTLTGCRRWPKEAIVAYATPPAGHVPGVSEYFASSYELGGVSTGVLVQSFDFRPIKVEGNPSHPFSRSVDERIGAATHFEQASILEMYDPHRSTLVVDRRGADAAAGTWDNFLAWAREVLAAERQTAGAGIAILSEATASPTTLAAREAFLAAFPQARWYTWEPLHRDSEVAGGRLAFGRAVRPVLQLQNASVVLLLDDDVLGRHPATLRYSADWVTRRRTADQGQMSRVYMLESGYTNTGGNADVRVPTRVAEIEAFVQALAAAVGVAGVTAPTLSAELQPVLEKVRADLAAAGTAALVSAGPTLSAEAHALVHHINARLGGAGNTVRYVELPETLATSSVEQITTLAGEIRGGKVNTLLVLGGNPAFDAPAELDFGSLLAGLRNTVHLSLYDNETSLASKWHLPRAHYLETWGDGRAWDGTLSHQQPLIQPLYNGRNPAELLMLLTGVPVVEPDVLVRQAHAKTMADDAAYRRFVHDGVLADSGFAAVTTPPTTVPTLSPRPTPAGFEVRFAPSWHVYDGRFGNNGWLLEFPDPLTKLTWDNAALISIADAAEMGVETGDLLQIDVNGRSMQIAAYVLPGQPKGVIELPLGWGRRAAGPVGDGTGFDTYTLRTAATSYVAAGATIARTGARYDLASTQEHHLIDDVGAWGREKRIGKKHENGKIIKEATLGRYREDPKFVNEGKHGNLRLQVYEPPDFAEWKQKAEQLRAAGHPDPRLAFNVPHAWGMAIDMNACTGCGACVIACQAENNIPIVGKTEVMRSREMHWIRIDRYFKGSGGSTAERMLDPNPEVVFQPMLCVHCENAPCEQVCPVAATVHDTEGLNTMVYNRCIGTRYCSNNCPYKVRRFNYLDWHSQDPRHVHPRPWLGIPDQEQKYSIEKVKQMLFNPEVTVRMRGVMEKCTFCTQRIKSVTITARNQNREVRDGEILTACQQTCPTQAIVFGDLNDPKAQVTRLHLNDRAYEVLEDLNTRPRGKHLARIRNVEKA